MIIPIERKHIRKGKRNNYKSCPIALAIYENLTHLGKHTTPIVRIDKKWIHVSRAKEIGFAVLEMTEDLMKDVLIFDKTGQMKPFQLDLTKLKVISGDLKPWQ